MQEKLALLEEMGISLMTHAYQCRIISGLFNEIDEHFTHSNEEIERILLNG